VWNISRISFVLEPGILEIDFPHSLKD
jgi:hypothetical protein